MQKNQPLSEKRLHLTVPRLRVIHYRVPHTAPDRPHTHLLLRSCQSGAKPPHSFVQPLSVDTHAVYPLRSSASSGSSGVASSTTKQAAVHSQLYSKATASSSQQQHQQHQQLGGGNESGAKQETYAAVTLSALLRHPSQWPPLPDIEIQSLVNPMVVVLQPALALQLSRLLPYLKPILDALLSPDGGHSIPLPIITRPSILDLNFAVNLKVVGVTVRLPSDLYPRSLLIQLTNIHVESNPTLGLSTLFDHLDVARLRETQFPAKQGDFVCDTPESNSRRQNYIRDVPFRVSLNVFVSIAPKQEPGRSGDGKQQQTQTQPFHGVFTRLHDIRLHTLVHCGDTEHYRLVKRRPFFTDHERHMHWKASRRHIALIETALALERVQVSIHKSQYNVLLDFAQEWMQLVELMLCALSQEDSSSSATTASAGVPAKINSSSSSGSSSIPDPDTVFVLLLSVNSIEATVVDRSLQDAAALDDADPSVLLSTGVYEVRALVEHSLQRNHTVVKCMLGQVSVTSPLNGLQSHLFAALKDRPELNPDTLLQTIKTSPSSSASLKNSEPEYWRTSSRAVDSALQQSESMPAEFLLLRLELCETPPASSGTVSIQRLKIAARVGSLVVGVQLDQLQKLLEFLIPERQALQLRNKLQHRKAAKEMELLQQELDRRQGMLSASPSASSNTASSNLRTTPSPSPSTGRLRRLSSTASPSTTATARFGTSSPILAHRQLKQPPRDQPDAEDEQTDGDDDDQQEDGKDASEDDPAKRKDTEQKQSTGAKSTTGNAVLALASETVDILVHPAPSATSIRAVEWHVVVDSISVVSSMPEETSVLDDDPGVTSADSSVPSPAAPLALNVLQLQLSDIESASSLEKLTSQRITAHVGAINALSLEVRDRQSAHLSERTMDLTLSDADADQEALSSPSPSPSASSLDALIHSVQRAQVQEDRLHSKSDTGGEDESDEPTRAAAAAPLVVSEDHWCVPFAFGFTVPQERVTPTSPWKREVRLQLSGISAHLAERHVRTFERLAQSVQLQRFQTLLAERGIIAAAVAPLATGQAFTPLHSPRSSARHARASSSASASFSSASSSMLSLSTTTGSQWGSESESESLSVSLSGSQEHPHHQQQHPHHQQQHTPQSTGTGTSAPQLRKKELREIRLDEERRLVGERLRQQLESGETLNRHCDEAVFEAESALKRWYASMKGQLDLAQGRAVGCPTAQGYLAVLSSATVGGADPGAALSAAQLREARRFVKLLDWRVCVWRTEQQAQAMQAPESHFRISEHTLLDTCDHLHFNAFRLRTPPANACSASASSAHHPQQHSSTATDSCLSMILVAPSDQAMGEWISALAQAQALLLTTRSEHAIGVTGDESVSASSSSAFEQQDSLEDLHRKDPTMAKIFRALRSAATSSQQLLQNHKILQEKTLSDLNTVSLSDDLELRARVLLLEEELAAERERNTQLVDVISELENQLRLPAHLRTSYQPTEIRSALVHPTVHVLPAPSSSGGAALSGSALTQQLASHEQQQQQQEQQQHDKEHQHHIEEVHARRNEASALFRTRTKAFDLGELLEAEAHEVAKEKEQLQTHEPRGSASESGGGGESGGDSPMLPSSFLSASASATSSPSHEKDADSLARDSMPLASSPRTTPIRRRADTASASATAAGRRATSPPAEVVTLNLGLSLTPTDFVMIPASKSVRTPQLRTPTTTATATSNGKQAAPTLPTRSSVPRAVSTDVASDPAAVPAERRALAENSRSKPLSASEPAVQRHVASTPATGGGGGVTTPVRQSASQTPAASQSTTSAQTDRQKRPAPPPGKPRSKEDLLDSFKNFFSKQ